MGVITEDRRMRRLSREAGLHLIAGLLMVVLAAFAISWLGGISALSVAQAIAAYVVMAVFLSPLLRQHLPLRRFGGANRVTLARGVLVACLAGVIGHLHAAPQIIWLLVAIASLALALDGLDGWLARHRGTASRFGARFDQELDTFLILVLSLLALELGKAGPWILAAGLLRYLFLLAAALWPVMAAPLPPSRRRQLLCVTQVVGLILCLLPVIETPTSDVIAGLALAGLVLSFAIDCLWLINRNWKQREQLHERKVRID